MNRLPTGSSANKPVGNCLMLLRAAALWEIGQTWDRAAENMENWYPGSD